jgi:hypothetical protein
VHRLDLTASCIVVAFAFESDDLCFGEDHAAGFRHLALQGGEPLLEPRQAVSQPYAAHSCRRDEHALLPELVAGAHLSIRREVQSERDHRGFSVLVCAILLIGLTPALLDQRFDTAGLDSGLVSIKRIS